jgi:hypothetical protein
MVVCYGGVVTGMALFDLEKLDQEEATGLQLSDMRMAWRCRVVWSCTATKKRWRMISTGFLRGNNVRATIITAHVLPPVTATAQSSNAS